MEPITREEYYLAKIAGTYKGKTPEPVTIDEYYLATMAGDYSGNTPQPVTRLQYYMAKVAGVWGGSIPAPVTRLEYYWAAIASGEGKVFPPVTREEHFLVLVADAYSVVLTVVTGNPALLENSKGNRGLESLTLYGKSTQGSTTGANILKDTYLSLCKGGVDLFTANGLFTVNANYEKACEFNLYFSAGSIFSDGIKDEATYYFAFRPIGFTPKYSYQLSLKNEKSESFSTSFNGNVTSVSGADLKKNVRIQLYFFSVSVSEPVVSGSKFQMIFSQKPDCNYEPYTGGAPSPSPEYPQEIESVGDAGEISVEVCGKNLIAGRKFYGNYSNGIAYIIKLDGDVVFPYKPSYATYGICYAINALAGKKYTFSGYNLNDNASLRIAEYANLNDALDFANVIGYKFGGSADTFVTYTAKENGVIICLISGIWSSNNDLIHICTESELLQIELGSTATSYEPYKPAQKLIIPTPNGLPGIPVSSGGNYTDADGQQWVCDEVDFKKGVYVQRVATETPKAKWKNFEETADVPNRYCISGALVNRYRDGSTKCLISHGIYANWGIAPGWALNSTTFYYHPKEDVTKEEAKEQILGFINSANPLTFLGQLETPIEKPLTTEQLATYKALRTYSPTTTVANDAEAGMSVGYAKMK